MPWLNWSLKLHIRLRTISLLISTHNTQVYVQWMSYSFVWLYLIKCVFTCSIFIDSNTKRFLSVLVVFGKYFVFTKTENFKNSVALFWRLYRGSNKSHATVASSRVSFGDLFVSGRSSREGYTEIFTAQLATPSRVSLSSREKHLEKFSRILFSKCFAAYPKDLTQSRKSRVLHIEGYFQSCFQKLFIFPSCIIIIVHTFISCPLFSLTPLSIRVKKGESIL